MNIVNDYGGSATPPEHRDSWQTPPEIFAALNRDFRFVADVAASAQNHLLPVYFTEQDDALALALAFPAIKRDAATGSGDRPLRDGLRPLFLTRVRGKGVQKLENFLAHFEEIIIKYAFNSFTCNRVPIIKYCGNPLFYTV